MTDKLSFGYNPGVPEGTDTAWGGRAILGSDGHADLPYDRVDAYGPDERRLPFLEYLRNVVGSAPFDHAAVLVRGLQMRPGVAEEFTLYEDDAVKVVGNTNASHGYLYVAAFPKEGASFKRYVAKREPITAERWEKVYGWPRVEAQKMAGSGSEVRVYVENDGETRDLEHHVQHSPDGFEYGYGGSGPSELARCIVIDALEIGHHRLKALKDLGEDVPNVQAVKMHFIASAPQSEPLVIYAADVLAFLTRAREAVGA